MKTDIFIFGMGNMGKRHLQGVSKVNCYEKIYGFDISKESLSSVDKFCVENNIDQSGLVLIDSFNEIVLKINNGSIVIVATTAKGRVELLGQIILKKPRAIIVEKPLCQNEVEYKEILKIRKEYDVPIYLNFPRHMYPYYQKIFNELQKLEARSFNVNFGGGMSCVGIHVFDLITWLFRIEKYKIVYSSCSDTYESKRKGFFDFEGKIVFVGNDKVPCSVSVTKDKSLQTVEISTISRQYRINEMLGEMTISDGLDSEKKEKADFLFVSQIIGPAVEDILKGPSFVKLASIEQSYLAHKILFEFMNIHNKEGVNIT